MKLRLEPCALVPEAADTPMAVIGSCIYYSTFLQIGNFFVLSCGQHPFHVRSSPCIAFFYVPQTECAGELPDIPNAPRDIFDPTPVHRGRRRRNPLVGLCSLRQGI